MKCPHCLDSYFSNFNTVWTEVDGDTRWGISWDRCPACNRLIVLEERWPKDYPSFIHGNANKSNLLLPRVTSRQPIPKEVPDKYLDDYKEACLVIGDSPKASSALSRRCLQLLLREHVGVQKQDLAKEIQEVIDSGQLPSYISEAIDAVRNIGNFAAHPLKSTGTGGIVDVEPGEAEWNLDVLEMLFDFYFVQPALAQKKKDALNKKLADINKPPMK
jgi:hypothetical protein